MKLFVKISLLLLLLAFVKSVKTKKLNDGSDEFRRQCKWYFEKGI